MQHDPSQIRRIYLPSGSIILSLLSVLLLLLTLPRPLGAQEPSESASLMAPLKPTPAMIAWGQRVTRGTTDPEKGLRRLWRGLMDPRHGGLKEQDLHTPTVSEAFESRQVNCVGLAALLVSLAREVGIPAFFVTVEIEDPQTARGDLRLREEHLAAAVGPPHAVRVFDFGGERDGTRLDLEAISDLTVLALFHSNRGVEALLASQIEAATESLNLAVELAPELPTLWVNLGVALRRQGRLQAAESAYRRALRLDPMAEAARSNLVALLSAQGLTSEAADLAEQGLALLATKTDSLSAFRRARDLVEAGQLNLARRTFAHALQLAQTSNR